MKNKITRLSSFNDDEENIEAEEQTDLNHLEPPNTVAPIIGNQLQDIAVLFFIFMSKFMHL